MTVLRSYVGGRWYAPDSGTPVYDAVTGETVAEVSSAGIDFGAALDYGRATGGPALRELTFHERAALAKAAGGLLREHRDELYELSYRTGATLGDSKFDIDGGIGVLLSYASKAKRELPNERFFVEGPAEQLGKAGQFLGQHLLTPRRGVAVQINAFNFPVWGPLEKLAPALIAGVPTLIKPASQTGYLTARVVELIIEAGLLPAGALQLVSGSAGDLLDHLGEQDLLSFTGSASTAHRLRSHPNVVARSVRFNAEADSLNMSILGPDATPGTAGFDRYVQQLVTEMTVKAGQKCTAIRRAFVPAGQLDAVTEAVRERLATVVVGNPRDKAVQMGALASLEQREEVRRSLKALEDAGSIVFGDPEHVEVTGADATRGAFLSPVLIRAEDPRRAEVHEVEAFGPVSTLIGYRDTADVIELAAPGQGQPGRLGRHRRPGLRPRGGPRHRPVARPPAGAGRRRGARVHRPRLAAADAGARRPGARGRRRGDWAACAGCSTTCSAPRSRPARRMLERGHRALGQGRAADQRRRRTRSPSRWPSCASATPSPAGPRTVTLDDIAHFAEFTGDTFYAHTDEEAAAKNPFFGGRVAHGYLIVSFAAGLFVQPDFGPVLANYGIDNLRFLTPLKPGDAMTVTLTCKQISPRAGDYGEVRWDAEVTNQDGTVVATYDVLTMVAKEWNA